jgi:transcriptional regulator with XRE-family HTH domain
METNKEVKEHLNKSKTESQAESQSQWSDFRLYLQDEFLRRIKTNPQYSLRAYAHFFDMNSGSLSQILKGQRKLSVNSITKMAQKLNLSPDMVESFKDTGKNGSTQPTQVEQLTMDSFNVISDWYHFAMLELSKTQGFKSEPQWISNKLGVNVNEVNAAIERLRRVDMLRINERNEWEIKSENLSTLNNDFSTVALRKLQTQILEQAMNALENTPIEERSQTALTVSINKDDLETVKNMIHRFRRELNAFVESNSVKDEVYNISFSLYPVSKNNK